MTTMQFLTLMHHIFRLLFLLGLLFICNSATCSSANESFVPSPEKSITTSLDTIEPGLIIQVPERMVGEEAVEIILMRTTKILLQEISISLASNNKAIFQLIKINGESGGTNAKLAEVTDYSPRPQEDMTQPIKMKLNQDNQEKDAAITITIQQGERVLAQKEIKWVKDGINISLQPKSFLANDRSEIILNLKNIGNKPVDLRQIIINCECTDSQMKFMLGDVENVSSHEANCTLEQVTKLNELGSQLQLQVAIRPYMPLQDKVAIGLRITLLEKQDKKKDKNSKDKNIKYETPQIVASIPVLFYANKISKIKKQIGQLIGERGERLDLSLISLEFAKLTTCLTKLEEGVEMYAQLLDQYRPMQTSNSNFGPLVSNISFTYSKQMEEWKRYISQIREIVKKRLKNEEFANRAATLQQDLEKIPNIIQGKVTSVNEGTNIKDITALLVADYNRELPIEQQSVYGLCTHAKDIPKEIDYIDNFSKQLPSTNIGNSSLITEQVKAIEKQAQGSLKKGFEKFKSVLSQQQSYPSSTKELKKQEIELKSQIARNHLYDQLELQASVLDTWSKYISLEQEKASPEDILYIVQAYKKITNEAVLLAQAYYDDKLYQGSIHKCAKLVTEIATKAVFLAQVKNDDIMKSLAINMYQDDVKIFKILEKLSQTKKLHASHKIHIAEDYNFYVVPAMLAQLNRELAQQQHKISPKKE